MAGRPEKRWLDGAGGRLDGRLLGPGSGRPVLILHPHPLFGGTMGSRFVYDLAVALADDGMRTVRYDSRGTGRSPGRFGGGPDEAADAVAVLDALAAEADLGPVLVGHSFGGAVAVEAAARAGARGNGPAALVAVAVPQEVRDATLRPIDAARRVACPAAVVIADDDPLVSAADALALHGALGPGARLERLAQGGHFLDPADAAAGVEAVRRLLPRLLGQDL